MVEDIRVHMISQTFATWKDVERRVGSAGGARDSNTQEEGTEASEENKQQCTLPSMIHPV